MLAGPGAEHLREIVLGSNGLVARGRTEVDKVLTNLDEIRTLNPRLVLTITSLRTLKQALALGKTPLDGVHFVDFGSITGGATSLNDAKLEALAPALANVRYLQLPCRGDKHFTPAGLRILGHHVKKLRYLAIDYYAARIPKPPGYAAVLAQSPGFATLRGLEFDGLTPRDIPGRNAHWCSTPSSSRAAA